jgi:hypothetical protein
MKMPAINVPSGRQVSAIFPPRYPDTIGEKQDDGARPFYPGSAEKLIHEQREPRRENS